jgi:hypothetical protein
MVANQQHWHLATGSIEIKQLKTSSPGTAQLIYFRYAMI